MSEFPSLEITLPLPPSINHAYIRGRIPTPELTAYKIEAANLLSQKHREKKGIYTRVKAWGYTAKVYVSTMASDADNYLKFGQDMLALWLGANDKRVCEFHVYKDVDKAHPRVEYTLYVIPTKAPRRRTTKR